MGAAMEFVGVVTTVLTVAVVVHRMRINAVKRDIGELREEIRALQENVFGAHKNAQDSLWQARVPPAPDMRPEAAAQEAGQTAQKTDDGFEDLGIPSISGPLPYVAMRMEDAPRSGTNELEQSLATKIPVWIGAISLICAAFFLVKYSIELGWMKPAVRVSLGGLFGFGLAAAGQWIVRRSDIANYERIAQALAGAGIVAMYVSLYAALNLYQLLPPAVAFGGMAAVTAAAVVLSLRHGQPIAVFGLVGGLLTPALVGADNPNAWGMFGYLFLLFTCMFGVFVKKGWWGVAIAAVVGVFGWTAFWVMVPFRPEDASALALFVLAIAVVVLVVTGRKIIRGAIAEGDGAALHGLNYGVVAGGVGVIFWLSFKISLGLFDWGVLSLMGLGVCALTFFQPSVYRAALPALLGVKLILFRIWADGAETPEVVAVIALLSAVYVAVPAYLMRRTADPRFWAGVQVAAAVALYTLAFLVGSIQAPFEMFWGLAGLILAGTAACQAADIRVKYAADLDIQDYLVAVYALAVTAFISIGFAIELPWRFFPLALAGQAAATAWVFHELRIPFLKTIVMILVAVLAASQFEQIGLFLYTAAMSVAGRAPGPFAGSLVLGAPLFDMGVPAVLVGCALAVFARAGQADKAFFHCLFGTAFLMGLWTAYYLLNGAFYGDYAEAFSRKSGFIERGIVTIALGGLGLAGLMLAGRLKIETVKPWAMALAGVAALRYVYFDGLIHNPFWTRQAVGALPLLNGVTLTYGAAAGLWLWAARCPQLARHAQACKGMALVSLFAWVTLSVRQYFHGDIIRFGSVGAAELYTYSAAWLLTGLGLLGLGIRKELQAARFASLGFMVAAVLKVFLYDASELEGLYRVFSFLGLGVSLIGLSFFYTRFVFQGQGKVRE